MLPGLDTALYIIVLCAASAAWQFGRGNAVASKFRPWATTTGFIVVAVPSLVQLTMAPQLLGTLQRDGVSGWLAAPYRLFSSLIVQDGGWPGAIWDLAALLWIGLMAESVWGARRWAVLALGAGIGAQLWGWVVQPMGAGNSVVVFGLAASLLLRGLGSYNRVARITGALGLLAAFGLFVGGDIHGGAALIGVALAAPFLLKDAQSR